MADTRHADYFEFTALGTVDKAVDGWRGSDGLDVHIYGTFEAVIDIYAKRADQPDADFSLIRTVTEPMTSILDFRGDWVLRFICSTYTSGTVQVELR